MGAGTSDLQREVSSIETKFAAHETEYKVFQSSEGEKLRKEFDTHLSSYAKGGFDDTQLCGVNLSCPLDGRYAKSSDLAALQTSVGARAAARAGGTAATGHFLDVQGKADQAGVTTLSEAVGRAAAGGAAATGLVGQVTTLSEALGRATAGGAAATGLFGQVTTLSEAVSRAADGGAAATGLFLDMQGKADQAGVTTLSEAVGRAAAGGAAATGLVGQVTTLSEAVGRAADGGAAATGLFTKVARLTAFMEQFESTATAGECAVNVQCPLESSYATSSDLAMLQASVGKAAGAATATGLFQQVGGLATTVGRAATGGAAATGLFQQVEVTRTELGGLGTAVGKAAAGGAAATGLFQQVDVTSAALGGLVASGGRAAAGSTAATGLFLAMQGKADQVGVAKLSAAVGKAAAGGAAATGLFQQLAAKATQVSGLEARVTSLERALVREPDASLWESKVEQGAFDALAARVGATAGSGPATGLFQRVDATGAAPRWADSSRWSAGRPRETPPRPASSWPCKARRTRPGWRRSPRQSAGRPRKTPLRPASSWPCKARRTRPKWRRSPRRSARRPRGAPPPPGSSSSWRSRRRR